VNKGNPCARVCVRLRSADRERMLQQNVVQIKRKVQGTNSSGREGRNRLSLQLRNLIGCVLDLSEFLDSGLQEI